MGSEDWDLTEDLCEKQIIVIHVVSITCRVGWGTATQSTSSIY